MKKKLKISIISLVALIGYTALLLFFSDTSQGEIIQSHEQPKTINYNSYDPYLIIIRKGNTKWRSLGVERTTSIDIVKSKGEDYGHNIELGITGIEPEDYTVIWTQEGIQISTPSKHSIWIPKESFIGGR